MKKLVYLATLVAFICLYLASCSQEEPITRTAGYTDYSTEIATRGIDGYVKDCTHICKYGAFLTDMSGIKDQKTLLWLKNAMWSSDTTNYFKLANKVDYATFIIVGKRDALVNKSAVKAFYDQDKPVVLLYPGDEKEFNRWLDEMGDSIMKNNVSANASDAYYYAQGNHIAAVFTKNRMIVVDEAGNRSPKDNAKYIIENLNCINTQAMVLMPKNLDSASYQFYTEFVSSLSGIDSNPDFSNFLIVDNNEVMKNRDYNEIFGEFVRANKPTIVTGYDLDSLPRNSVMLKHLANRSGVGDVAQYIDYSKIDYSKLTSDCKVVAFICSRTYGIPIYAHRKDNNWEYESCDSIWSFLHTYF